MAQTALITGASSGIGECFARTLAQSGYGLILVARSEDKLQALAADLRSQHGLPVTVILSDLTKATAVADLAAAVQAQGLTVDFLINNAGFGSAGAFAKASAERDAQMIALNVQALVALCHVFLPAMQQREHGAILNVASTAAFQPLPGLAIYAATKAFVLSFTEALWAEARRKGVTVTALCPGPVDTPFFEATGTPTLRSKVPNVMMMSPQAVVDAALAGIKSGKPVVVPGLSNKATSVLPRFMPRRLMALASGVLMGR